MEYNPLEIISKSKNTDLFCSPKNKNNTSFSCFSENNILELVSIFNSDFCDANKSFCKKNGIILIMKNGQQRPTKDIYNELRQKLVEFNKKNSNEYCWLKINQFRNKFVTNQNLFVPEMPTEWCDQIKHWRISRIEAPWLSNYDIDEVSEQYEIKYPSFKFLGSIPIDFRKIKDGSCILNLFVDSKYKARWLTYNKQKGYCDFDVSSYKNKTSFGIVFNTDTHDGNGKHWMSLYINLETRVILFFDSAVTYSHLHPEITLFIENIKEQYKHLHFTFKYNTVQHQQSNSECGMYSIYLF